jgi:hypothetical protein
VLTGELVTGTNTMSNRQGTSGQARGEDTASECNGARVKPWCLLIHTEAYLSLSAPECVRVEW